MSVRRRWTGKQVKPATVACIAADPRDVTDDTVDAWSVAVTVVLGDAEGIVRQVEAHGLTPARLSGWYAAHAKAVANARSRQVGPVREALAAARMLTQDAWTLAKRTAARGAVREYWDAYSRLPR